MADEPEEKTADVQYAEPVGAEEPAPDLPKLLPAPAGTSRPFNRRLMAVVVGGLLLLATVGVASSQNLFGGSPAATPAPRAGSNPPYMGSTQGCAATFWANSEHYAAWEEYTPDQLVGTVFGHAGTYASMSFANALAGQTSGEDARRTLLRQAVAAALNAANDSLAFPYARYDTGVDGRPPLVPTTNRLFATGSDQEIAQFTSELAQANSLGCPL